MKSNSLLCERIKKCREDRGLTQAQLADELHIHRQVISYYENGTRKPDIDSLVMIAQFFNTSTDYLLGISDVHSLDADVQAICAYTGLSEHAIHRLNYYKEHLQYADIYASEELRKKDYYFETLFELSKIYRVYLNFFSFLAESGFLAKSIASFTSSLQEYNTALSKPLTDDRVNGFLTFLNGFRTDLPPLTIDDLSNDKLYSIIRDMNEHFPPTFINGEERNYKIAFYDVIEQFKKVLFEFASQENK